jgi:hypothetical protein
MMLARPNQKAAKRALGSRLSRVPFSFASLPEEGYSPISKNEENTSLLIEFAKLLDSEHDRLRTHRRSDYAPEHVAEKS